MTVVKDVDIVVVHPETSSVVDEVVTVDVQDAPAVPMVNSFVTDLNPLSAVDVVNPADVTSLHPDVNSVKVEIVKVEKQLVPGVSVMIILVPFTNPSVFVTIVEDTTVVC